MINSNIIKLQQSIAEELGADTRQVQLIAVSKNASIEQMQATINAGIYNFGESYIQEAIKKQKILNSEKIIWHFIGSIQSNKTEYLAQNFAWVHGVEREVIASLLSKYRPAHLPALQVCIQVNIDNDQAKSGVDRSEIKKLADYIYHLPNVHLRGLMCILKASVDPVQQELSFKKLRECLEELNHDNKYNLDTLSMGMSDDYKAALRAGSNMLRIGKLIFKE